MIIFDSKLKQYDPIISFRYFYRNFRPTRAVGRFFKPGGPMVESKPQMMRFIAVDLDFPKNRVGQAHLADTLATALPTLLQVVNCPRASFWNQNSALFTRNIVL